MFAKIPSFTFFSCKTFVDFLFSQSTKKQNSSIETNTKQKKIQSVFKSKTSIDLSFVVDLDVVTNLFQ